MVTFLDSVLEMKEDHSMSNQIYLGKAVVNIISGSFGKDDRATAKTAPRNNNVIG